MRLNRFVVVGTVIATLMVQGLVLGCGRPFRTAPRVTPDASTPLPIDVGQPDGNEFWKIDYRQNTAVDELKIATYNVLNLFNADHDIDENGNGKDDYSFLPKDFPGKRERCEAMGAGFYQVQCLETDWQPWRVELRYSQIRRALESQGDLPDLLAVQEIENGEVAAGLMEALGFDEFRITNSADKRGIDVALFFRNTKLKYLEHEEIVLTKEDDQFFAQKPSRNILRVHFRLQKGDSDVVVGVYANHWPSNSNPGTARMAAAKALQRAIDAQTAKIGKDKYFVVVMGDFNTLESQKPNPFDDVIESSSWENALADSQKLGLSHPRHPFPKSMPRSTYWYHQKNSWDKLDRILFSKNFLQGSSSLALLPETFRIVGSGDITGFRTLPSGAKPNPKGKPGKVVRAPIETDFTYPKNPEDLVNVDPAKAGFSDHLPVVVKVKIQ